jgi:cell wall assembly regulator SMI1
MNTRYIEWVKIWKETQEQIGNVIEKENLYPLVMKPPATIEEVEEVEKKLGYTLPATFRHTLLHFSKEVDLFWNMYGEVEDIIPEEFEGISSGLFDGGFITLIWKI